MIHLMAEQHHGIQRSFSALQFPRPNSGGIENLACASAVGRTVAFDYVTLTDGGKTVSPDGRFAAPGSKEEATASADVPASSHFRRQLVEYLEKQDRDIFAAHDRSQGHFSLSPLQAQAAPVSATMSNGTRVSVSTSSHGATVRLALSDGRTLAVDGISGDVRFSHAENGELLMITGDATFAFDAQGNRIVTGEGGDALAGTDGNDVIINFSDSAVRGGAGDDLVITYASRADISGGDGNDKVIVAGRFVQSLDISLGDGDDSLEVAETLNADIRIDGGDGNDSIRLGKVMGDGDISLNGGDGDDGISIDFLSAGSVVVSGGNGNDEMEVGFLYAAGRDAGRLDGGAGDDRIFVQGLHGASIDSGGGNDVIRVGSAVDSVIDGGDGDNEISVGTMFRSLLVNGLGNDAISVTSMISSMILSPEMLATGLWENVASPDGKAPRDDGEDDTLRGIAWGGGASRTFEAVLAQSSRMPELPLKEAAPLL